MIGLSVFIEILVMSIKNASRSYSHATISLYIYKHG